MSRESGAALETPSVGRDSPAAAFTSPFSPATQHDVFTAEKGDAGLSHSTAHAIPLVSSHPPLKRDDRPVSHVHYDNPAEATPLARSLWLPRDPLVPVDLGDTVDYNGRVLVSSEGGDGIIGSFEAFCETDDEEDDEYEADDPNDQVITVKERSDSGFNNLAAPPPSSPALSRKTSRAPSHVSIDDFGLTLKGNVRVRVAADVAAKVALAGGSPAAASTSQQGGGVSDQASIVSGMRRRRSTQTSLTFAPTPSPPQSPVLRRSPNDPRPPFPAIPSFTQEPVADPNLLSPHSANPEDSTFPFPAPDSPSQQSTTSPTRKPRRLTISSLSPPSSRIGIGSPPIGTMSSSASRRRSTRTQRSNSLAPSIQRSITLSRIDEPGAGSNTGEGDEDRQEVISQAAALRAELLHEEILSHQRHVKQAQAQSEQESKDREGKSSGFLKRFVVREEIRDSSRSGPKSGLDGGIMASFA